MNLPQALIHVIQKTANPALAEHVLAQTQDSLGSTLNNLSEAKLSAFLNVMGNSPFLARWVQKETEAAKKILASDWSSLPSTAKDLLFLKDPKEILQWEEPKLHQRLLQAKYEQLFRITLLDMGLQEDFTKTAWQLSELAKQILSLSLNWWLANLAKQYGTPHLKNNHKQALPFTVLGMGKLGGMELNFSSDIDLIYFYESDEGELLQEDKRLSQRNISTPHAFFCKLATKLSKFLHQRASGGFLYRVDLELRPEGKSGALTNSLNAMEYYYENFGAAWEKQAFIKAGLAAGSQELYEKLLQILQPFIYPKATDFRLLERIQDMKQRLAASIQHSSSQGYHVKLGSGGIRELEFFVQSLQLLYGGKHPELQTHNTLHALEQLKKLTLISESSWHQLTQAYLFLRTLENRLQQVEEQQTHRFPEDEEEKQQTARRMGYGQESPEAAARQLEEDLKKHRQVVEEHFRQLLAQNTEG